MLLVKAALGWNFIAIDNACKNQFEIPDDYKQEILHFSFLDSVWIEKLVKKAKKDSCYFEFRKFTF